MKKTIVTRFIPLLLVATFAVAEGGEKDVIVRRGESPARIKMRLDKENDRPVEKEKVAYLGVETMPVSRTTGIQLGLPRDTGLVVRRVAEGSAAAAVLKEHDILLKLNDQILIDMRQLSVLVRSQKPGDEIKLTVMRGGKETVVSAKLGEREVPKEGQGFGLIFGHDFPDVGSVSIRRGAPGLPLEGPDAEDVMRVIGGERPHWFAKPRVHVLKRGVEKGATVLDLPSGNFVFSDDVGSVEVNATDGKRELTVKDKQGTVTFRGPINTSEDHAKLPPEVVARLDAIRGVELQEGDEDFEWETHVVEPVTKAGHRLPALPAAPEAGMRSL